MDLDQLNYLTDDQKDRYVTLERTFDSKGWKIVEAWAVQRAQEEFQRAGFAATWEDHQRATGARMAFEQLAALRDATELEFVNLAESNMLNQQEEEELNHE
jgi:hypothetical protein